MVTRKPIAVCPMCNKSSLKRYYLEDENGKKLYFVRRSTTGDVFYKTDHVCACPSCGYTQIG